MHLSKKLGLRQETIYKIQSSFSSSDKCLKKALTVWLKGCYNQVVYGPPTLGSLCAAVAHPNGGGDRDLAMKTLTLHNCEEHGAPKYGEEHLNMHELVKHNCACCHVAYLHTKNIST